MFAGSIQSFNDGAADEHKSVVVQFAGAYPVPALEQACRRLTIDGWQNIVWLEDSFSFADGNHEVEDVFVTWFPVTIVGSIATIHGNRHHLQLSTNSSSGAALILESLVDESRANDRDGVLQRLRVRMSGAMHVQARFRLDIVPVPSSNSTALA